MKGRDFSAGGVARGGWEVEGVAEMLALLARHPGWSEG